jgi:hypothetical protein
VPYPTPVLRTSLTRTQNDVADMDVPDQQALMNAFMATRNMSCINL